MTTDGKQGDYDEDDPMKACTVECKYANSNTYFAPHLKVEGMNSIDTDGFFNDGTFCHEEEGTKFYCK